MRPPKECTCGGDSWVEDVAVGVVRHLSRQPCMFRRRTCVKCGAEWTTAEIRLERDTLKTPPKEVEKGHEPWRF